MANIFRRFWEYVQWGKEKMGYQVRPEQVQAALSDLGKCEVSVGIYEAINTIPHGIFFEGLLKKSEIVETGKGALEFIQGCVVGDKGFKDTEDYSLNNPFCSFRSRGRRTKVHLEGKISERPNMFTATLDPKIYVAELIFH